ncbi:MAG: amino acid carrier protein [Verrucomicrobia bacterium]|nr:amino acid carrier protein [Verrucomicrobiota bacterium]
MNHPSEWLRIFTGWVQILSDWVWGLPLVALLLGTGIYLAILSRFFVFRGFVHALRLVSGRYTHPGDADAPGHVTYFQGLMNSMASTIGLGNISGVAVAISLGGPGALFWMWVAALIGMNTRFFETTMVMLHRSADFRGEVQGGAMYVIRSVFPAFWHPLAYFFAAAGLIGTLAAFQSNQLAAMIHDQTGFPVWSTGLVSAAITAYVMMGGIPRLVATTSTLVPVMCGIYFVTAMVVILMNAPRIPGVFLLIFQSAFTGSGLSGGVAGIAVAEVIRQGVRRGTFSNEAGLGTAPLAHGNVRTSEPVAEGLVAMLGPFFDTLVICTLTALVILLAAPDVQQDSGILLTMSAFQNALSSFGSVVLSIVIVLFAFSTIVGMANYNRRCWNFLFAGRRGFQESSFILYFSLTILAGASFEMSVVINAIDIAYAFMSLPNLIAVLATSRSIASLTRTYSLTYLK